MKTNFLSPFCAMIAYPSVNITANGINGCQHSAEAQTSDVYFNDTMPLEADAQKAPRYLDENCPADVDAQIAAVYFNNKTPLETDTQKTQTIIQWPAFAETQNHVFSENQKRGISF